MKNKQQRKLELLREIVADLKALEQQDVQKAGSSQSNSNIG